MFEVRVPKPWIKLVSITVFLLLACGCSNPTVATPTNIVTNQLQIETSSAPEPTTSLVPPNTPMPTYTITPNATASLAGNTTATEEKKTYPLLSPSDLYANPDDYNGKRFQLEGVVLAYGMRKYDGKDVYVIQVGVPDFPRPIIVLNFSPNPKLGMHDGFIVGGTGGGAYYGIDPTDPKSFTPVILGEWYECNLPWDQWKYPYEFWNPIQLEAVNVN